MKRRARVAGILLLTLAGSSRVTAQQISSWVRAEATVRLGQTAPDKPIVGRFVTETPDSVFVTVRDSIRAIPVQRIRTVEVAFEFHNEAVRGAPLGAIAGAVIGAFVAKRSTGDDGAVLAYSAVGAVIGINLGWAFSSSISRPRWTAIPWKPPGSPE